MDEGLRQLLAGYQRRLYRLQRVGYGLTAIAFAGSCMCALYGALVEGPGSTIIVCMFICVAAAAFIAELFAPLPEIRIVTRPPRGMELTLVSSALAMVKTGLPEHWTVEVDEHSQTVGPTCFYPQRKIILPTQALVSLPCEQLAGTIAHEIGHAHLGYRRMPRFVLRSLCYCTVIAKYALIPQWAIGSALACYVVSMSLLQVRMWHEEEHAADRFAALVAPRDSFAAYFFGQAMIEECMRMMTPRRAVWMSYVRSIASKAIMLKYGVMAAGLPMLVSIDCHALAMYLVAARGCWELARVRTHPSHIARGKRILSTKPLH